MAVTIDWYYHRISCAMCRYAEQFIESRASIIKEKVIANQHKLGAEQAQALVHEVQEIWVTRGKKLLHFDMTSAPPTDTELLRLILAPSGNLRAPVLRVGKCLVVGFSREAYQQVLAA